MTINNSNPVSQWICAQIGRREHYAIPRALYAAGALNCLLTDFWAGIFTQQLSRIFPSKALRSLATRSHEELPSGLVKSWNLQALAWEIQLRRMEQNGSLRGRYLGYCKVGNRFTRAAIQALKNRRNLPENGVFFGYDTESLETMEFLKSRGFICILDQIDPCRVEAEIVQAEQRAWPGWEKQAREIPDEFFERHFQEWAVADRVVVNSEWSRQALIQQGVPSTKIFVLPLCYENNSPNPETGSHRKQEQASEPLRVLFLGQVVLRKGIQYLIEAARLLELEPVRFDIVGSIHISERAVASAPSNIVFHGRATRDQTNVWYRQSHLFVLPTLSDGFAITQLEAMANGLPVIATPNCGQVVSDGVDGFIVAPHDVIALAAAIRRYLEPALLERHQQAALQKAKQFSLERVGLALLKLSRVTHDQFTPQS